MGQIRGESRGLGVRPHIAPQVQQSVQSFKSTAVCRHWGKNGSWAEPYITTLAVRSYFMGPLARDEGYTHVAAHWPRRCIQGSCGPASIG